MDIMKEIERVANEKGTLLATALVQQKGNMHVVLVRLDREDRDAYCVWMFVMWPNQPDDTSPARPGYFGEGDYFHGRDDRDAFTLAWEAFVKRAREQRVYLKDEFEIANRTEA